MDICQMKVKSASIGYFTAGGLRANPANNESTICLSAMSAPPLKRPYGGVNLASAIWQGAARSFSIKLSIKLHQKLWAETRIFDEQFNGFWANPNLVFDSMSLAFLNTGAITEIGERNAGWRSAIERGELNFFGYNLDKPIMKAENIVVEHRC
jgi:hypothetical protein